MKKIINKSIIITLANLLIIISVFGQSPEKLSYQAVIRNSSDALVTKTKVGMKISILQGSTSGTAVYVETQTPTTNANGLVSIEIGGDDAAVVSGSFSSIDWSDGSYYIKTETDLAGGTSYTITGTSQLLSVPYALHAKTADSIAGGYSIGDYAQGGVVFWVDETGQHGLACAIIDQDGGSGIQWYNGSNTTTSAVGNGVYAGKMNTMLIIANQEATLTNYAAGICVNYTFTQNSITYGDWYLPSKYELYLLYNNKATINATAIANGGSSFATWYYWSSTENNTEGAWGHYFIQTTQNPYYKNDVLRVRAVRAF